MTGSTFHLQGLAEGVEAGLDTFARDGIPRRIWARDFTVWSDDPAEIVDRLGWLSLPEQMRQNLAELAAFADACAHDGLRTAVLAGMGGSSLAAEVFRHTFGVNPGGLDLVVLDSTHPEQILSVERERDLDEALFIVASKSGTTTETLAHLSYFWDKVPDGSRFVAITDPGTPLEALARSRGFRGVFLNPADIGGRYSALSLFGLVAAALIGVDVAALLEGGARMADECGPGVPADRNPAVLLGVAMGEAVRAGKDKLTLVLGSELRSFGPWAEQLLAESTGKDGTGIVPVEGEDLAKPGVYGRDRFFVGLGRDGVEDSLARLASAGHPTAFIPVDGAPGLAAEFFRWEFATAVAGAVLGINPFDQPNVQEAKDATQRALAESKPVKPTYDILPALLARVGPGDYLGIQAYLARNERNERRLHDVRMRLRDRLEVATTVGFGPRFLHSTGQLHKGGPDSGVFVQVVEPPVEDVAIPGERYSFARLLLAQADGDLASLLARGRRVGRVTMADLEDA